MFFMILFLYYKLTGLEFETAYQMVRKKIRLIDLVKKAKRS